MERYHRARQVKLRRENDRAANTAGSGTLLLLNALCARNVADLIDTVPRPRRWACGWMLFVLRGVLWTSSYFSSETSARTFSTPLSLEKNIRDYIRLLLLSKQPLLLLDRASRIIVATEKDSSLIVSSRTVYGATGIVM